MTSTKPARTAILVPGYWLGGWAWNEVIWSLAQADTAPVAVTLPGLESVLTHRAGIRVADHIDALVAAIRGAAPPIVLVAHSGAGAIATAALDAVPELVHRVVYVDCGPVFDGTIPRGDLSPDVVEVPLPAFSELEAAGASLAGLDEYALQRFRERAVPHPAGPLREPICLRNPGRTVVPTTVVCCSLRSEVVRGSASAGAPMFGPLTEYQDVSYVDLPTGHWPMWSEPGEVATLVARACHE